MSAKQTATPEEQAALKKARKRIYIQAGIAFGTILITIVLLFAVTAAWYTNVVKTSDLMFEAAAWGFEGEVQLEEAAITAAPGDSGVISMRVSNTSSELVVASVNVSKVGMSPDMQKRIYFYADTAAASNGETMERVYLNNTGSYSYTLLGNDEIVLTAEYHNDALLKWEWVYDVLGYYIKAVPGSNGRTVLEYLRPVVYNLDAATFDENGLLLTVDGVTTVPQFLAELTRTDGYPGVLDIPAQAANSGLYPIDAEEDVWLYLCNQSEIEVNTNEDTAYGELAANGEGVSFQARISISAQKEQLNTAAANSLQSLQDAFNNPTTDVIRLDSDVSMGSSAVSVYGDRNVILDLGGNTITSNTNNALFNVGGGASLTVINGKVSGEESSTAATLALVYHGNLTMQNVEAEDLIYGVYIGDNQNAGQDSKVRMVGCSLDTSYCGVMIFGNGSTSAQKTQVFIENCEIRGDYMGVVGNGTVGDGTAANPGNWGTDIQISNSIIYGKWAGVYQPQQKSTITITNDSEISGNTGVVVKCGSVRIQDSTVIGLGNENVQAPGLSSGGFYDTGDGVYVETNYNWSETTVEILGDSRISALNPQSMAVRKYLPDAANATIIVTGGLYSTDVSDFVAKGYECRQLNDSEEDEYHYIVAVRDAG